MGKRRRERKERGLPTIGTTFKKEYKGKDYILKVARFSILHQEQPNQSFNIPLMDGFFGE